METETLLGVLMYAGGFLGFGWGFSKWMDRYWPGDTDQ